jgi:hypothetical protein
MAGPAASPKVCRKRPAGRWGRGAAGLLFWGGGLGVCRHQLHLSEGVKVIDEVVAVSLGSNKTIQMRCKAVRGGGCCGQTGGGVLHTALSLAATELSMRE